MSNMKCFQTNLRVFLLWNPQNGDREKRKEEGSLLSKVFGAQRNTYGIIVADDCKSLSLSHRNNEGRTDSTTFTFDHIFGDSSTLDDVYRHSVHDIVAQFFTHDDTFQNGCLLAYGSPDSGTKYALFGSDGNNGLVHKLIEELYQEIQARSCTHELMCSVQKLHAIGLNGSSKDSEAQDVSYAGLKCESVDAAFDFIHSSVKEKMFDDSCPTVVTFKVTSVHNGSSGIINIIHIGRSVKKNDDVDIYSSESSSTSKGIELDHILGSSLEGGSISILQTVSRLDSHGQELLWALQFGSELRTTAARLVSHATFKKLQSEEVLSDENGHVASKSESDEFIESELDESSKLQLSLHASMLNSSIIKTAEENDYFSFNSEYESNRNSSYIDVKTELQDTSGKCAEQVFSETFVNIGKHLFEEHHNAKQNQLVVKEEETKTTDVQVTTKPKLLICFWKTTVLIALFGIFLSCLQNDHESPLDYTHPQCNETVVFVNVTEPSINYGQNSASRYVIKIIQDIDLFLTNDVPQSYDRFHIRGFLLLIALCLSSTIFFVSLALWHFRLFLTQSFKRSAQPDTDVMKSETERLPSRFVRKKGGDANPFINHPRIMSPLDTSKIFMSRYTGVVVTEHGCVTEVVRSSRVSTPSPVKFKQFSPAPANASVKKIRIGSPSLLKQVSSPESNDNVATVQTPSSAGNQILIEASA